MKNIINSVKCIIRPAYYKFNKLIHKIKRIDVDIPISKHGFRLNRMGTNYGGWNFVPVDTLYGSVLISCGLGEDASFDVEFAAKYGAYIIIVDPTPRAIEHFKGIISRLGKPSVQKYCARGAQPVTSYDLTNIKPYQLQLCDKALWNENTRLHFFSPQNPEHVSHSIVNFQNNYSTATPYIEVDTITIKNLLEEFNVQNIEVLKLDIEGAEVEVLFDMLAQNIFPRQILVEYDELLAPSRISKSRVEGIHNALVEVGYALIHRENSNFTYINKMCHPSFHILKPAVSESS